MVSFDTTFILPLKGVSVDGSPKAPLFADLSLGLEMLAPRWLPEPK